MANGGGGQYDLVSASGDADLRLIYGGDVKPVNINLIPSWKEFQPVPAEPGLQHDQRRALRGLASSSARTSCCTRPRSFKTAPTSWSVIYSKKYTGQITIPDNPIQIADAALYLSTAEPQLGITDPYELTQPQFNAAVNLLKQQHPLIKKYWDLASDEISLFRTAKRSSARRGPTRPDTLKAAGCQGRRHHPERGGDRLGRHLDAGDQGAPPQLRLQVDGLHHDAAGAGRAGRLLRRDAGQLAGLPDHGQAPEGLVRAPTTRTRPTSYFQSIKFWKTPLATCDNGKNDCVPFQDWVTAWTSIIG